MKRILFALSVIVPLTLFASDANVETDIVERSVNFFIFAGIVYYLLADKLKTFFADRTKAIQANLDKVQDLLKASEKKISDARLEIESAKKIADELIESANHDISQIKQKVEADVESEITLISKSYNEKISIEAKKVKQEVVENILDQLLSDDNINLSQNDLTNIILKKVA